MTNSNNNKNNSNIKKSYYGDDRILNRIYYSKKDQCRCVYCGNIANSREHIPSKCFLTKPFPENIWILPSCKVCNNSFSASEAKVARLLKWIMHHIEGGAKLSSSDLVSKFEYLEKRYSSNNINSIILKEEDRKAIEEIAYKLAIGHLMYSGSSFHTKSDIEIKFVFSFQCTDEDVDLFDESRIYLQNKMPEIGSRDFDLHMISSLEGEILPIKLWNIIQEDNYRFLLSWDGYLLIVIKGILYITIEFT